MKLLDTLKKITASGTATLVEKIGVAADSIFTNKEEAQKAKSEFEKIVLDHASKMEGERIREVEAQLKDIDSARNRELAIATSENAPVLNKIVSPILAIGTVALTFILFYIILFKQLGTEKDIIIYILGALTAITTQIFSYYFGSSAGSKAKSDQLNKIANNA